MDVFPLSRSALQYETEVTDEGRIELKGPFRVGTRLKIFVIDESVDWNLDSFEDLVQASETSLDFWDNPMDDEDWNNG